MTGQTLRLHASAVAWQGRAVLIRGKSGVGKSELALQLMGFGAALVADDQVFATLRGSEIELSAPEPIAGLVEARGVGLLRAEVADRAVLALVVDLDCLEEARLPEPREAEYQGLKFPLLHKCEGPSFPAAVLQYLKAGRVM